jgi:hypothetical protein
VSDALFNDVGAQLRFDEVNGETAFVDSSRHAATVSRFGGVVASNAQSVYGGTSALFPNDAASNYLTITGSQIVNSSAEMTMEAWVYPLALGAGGSEVCSTMTSGQTGGVRFGINSDGSLYSLWAWVAGGPVVSAGSVPLNQWTHVCLVNELVGPSQFNRRFFVNGNPSVHSQYSGGGVGSHTTLTVGTGSDGLRNFRGYMDDFRLTVGRCRYRGGVAFTPQRTGTFFEIPSLSAQPAPTLLVTSPVATPNWRTAQTPVLVRDVHDAGFGRILGTVKEKGAPTNLPLRRRVRLIHEFTGRLIRETWSDAATGNYEFVGIDPTQRYTVVTYDYTNTYRAVVADNLLPEVYTP